MLLSVTFCFGVRESIGTVHSGCFYASAQPAQRELPTTVLISLDTRSAGSEVSFIPCSGMSSTEVQRHVVVFSSAFGQGSTLSWAGDLSVEPDVAAGKTTES